MMSCQAKNGSATLEFVLILPWLVGLALMVLLFQELMLRAVCNSHAAFSASRQGSVRQFSGTQAANTYAREHYKGCGMRGHPEISIDKQGRHPRVWRTTVRDIYTILWPSGGMDGAFPEFHRKEFTDMAVIEEAAGTSYRSQGSDNEI
ncbi:MAG: pilus assembly protein [Verrucomicrobiae bacterium]|nr:pilus assembly protein [Verrucomicrobiae bacterium]